MIQHKLTLSKMKIPPKVESTSAELLCIHTVLDGKVKGNNIYRCGSGIEDVPEAMLTALDITQLQQFVDLSGRLTNPVCRKVLADAYSLLEIPSRWKDARMTRFTLTPGQSAVHRGTQMCSSDMDGKGPEISSAEVGGESSSAPRSTRARVRKSSSASSLTIPTTARCDSWHGRFSFISGCISE